jgi:hypothetical protein
MLMEAVLNRKGLRSVVIWDGGDGEEDDKEKKTK